MPNPNDPALVNAFVDRIDSDNGMPRTVDRERPCFYFIFDEMFLSQTRIPKPETRINDYWKRADATVKEKYGFGKFGLPESTDDTDPFRWIAYLRWQADLSVKTVRTLASAFRNKCPKAIILGPDEIATFCPHDWERMGREIDIATGQTLCAAGGSRRFNVGYLVKFHRDLTNRPVYPYVQLIKYGRSPTVETVYDWFDQLLQAGGEGAFVGAVEWFDRSLNHPKYAAPRKWRAVLDIVDTMQALPQVRRPEDKTMAVHFGSFTQMSRRTPDQTRMGATFAMLGPRAKAWFTFTDDFQIERDTTRWDEFKVVVLPDAKYADRSLCDAALRFVRRGGTLVVTDPEAFSFLLDGSDPAAFRKQLFGVARSEGEPQNTIVLNGLSVNNPDPRGLAVKTIEGEDVKTLVSFGDGSPAVVTHGLGKGNVWYFAFNPNTDATVYDPRWIRQWRSWLEELEVPLDQDIWRFRLPRKPLPEEPADRCLTGNAVRFRRNVGGVSMNVDVPGGYRYEIPPQASPDCDESSGDELIPFNKGLLTNRRKMLALTGPSGKAADKKTMAMENWVVRFGPEETVANAITVDLAEPRALSRCSLVYSGTLPEITIAGSIDGDSWKSIGTMAADSTSTKAVHVAENSVTGQFRYVRLAFAARKPRTTLTLAELEVWGVE